MCANNAAFLCLSDCSNGHWPEDDFPNTQVSARSWSFSRLSMFDFDKHSNGTMSVKSLETLPVIYAVDEQQYPLHRKTMLCGGDTNSTGGGEMMSFEVA